MVLRIYRHAVIEAAAFHRISANKAIGRWIDLRHFVRGPQSHVDLFCNRIVPRSPGFAVEPQNFYNLIFVDVHYADRLPKSVHDIHFSKRLCIGDSIGFRLCGQALDNRHRVEVDHADFLLAPIGCVHLVEARNVLESGNAR